MTIDTASIADYRAFLRVRQLPSYRFRGSFAEFPPQYAEYVTGRKRDRGTAYVPLALPPFLFDYQNAITRLALLKKAFAVFADCGLGKTLILLEWLRQVREIIGRNRAALTVCPSMVISQTLAEAAKWYGDDLPVQRIRAADLPRFCAEGRGLGITNFEALSGDSITNADALAALGIDESSMLKSHYGKWGGELIRLGRGCEFKLALTGTPAPNDRIEYANHAVFVGAHPTVNSFLARYFINRGETENRWEIKPHAIKPFYRDLSAWSIFLSDPSVYGWKPLPPIPPIHVTIHDVPLTEAQKRIVHETTGELIVTNLGGIADRAKLASVAKGYWRGETIETNKVGFMQDLVASWPDESTLTWCLYNREQEMVSQALRAATIAGDTPEDERMRIIDGFKAGRIRNVTTKPRILGYGLNLQIATRQLFSSLQDSYESYYQAVKRSNRIGSRFPLNVHIPVTEIERPMVDNVLRKARRVEQDTREQEELFREHGLGDWR